MSLLCERGEMSDSEAAGELVALASDTREPSMMAIGYAAAAKVLIAMGRSTQPQALLGELARASARATNSITSRNSLVSSAAPFKLATQISRLYSRTASSHALPCIALRWRRAAHRSAR